MLRELETGLQKWLGEGKQVALATVIWSEGPSPRPIGSQMAISSSGQIAGSVSGGCVEGTVIQESSEVLADGVTKRLAYGIVDEEGWEVGLACGGRIEVYLEPLQEIHTQLMAAIAQEETVALVTQLDGSGHALIWPDGRREGGSLLDLELDWTESAGRPLAGIRHTPAGDVFVQVFTTPPQLTIIGAVHLSQPLVKLAKVIGFHVRVVDGRKAFATRERFPEADELLVAWPQEGLKEAHLRPQDAVVILTHDPKFDLPALESALRSDVGYIGLLGSPTTQGKRRAALQERGFGEQDFARIHGPVGLDLGGREPEEIALAIVGEIVGMRHGKVSPRIQAA